MEGSPVVMIRWIHDNEMGREMPYIRRGHDFNDADAISFCLL
jgi:hypothetical protein